MTSVVSLGVVILGRGLGISSLWKVDERGHLRLSVKSRDTNDQVRLWSSHALKDYLITVNWKSIRQLYYAIRLSYPNRQLPTLKHVPG